MSVTRRRWLRSAAAAGAAAGTKTQAAAEAPNLEALRCVAAAHGADLSDERLKVLQPVLERRLPRLRDLRGLRIADDIEPVQGILAK
jgi:hypothetical protein